MHRYLFCGVEEWCRARDVAHVALRVSYQGVRAKNVHKVPFSLYQVSGRTDAKESEGNKERRKETSE